MLSLGRGVVGLALHKLRVFSFALRFVQCKLSNRIGKCLGLNRDGRSIPEQISRIGTSTSTIITIITIITIVTAVPKSFIIWFILPIIFVIEWIKVFPELTPTAFVGNRFRSGWVVSKKSFFANWTLCFCISSIRRHFDPVIQTVKRKDVIAVEFDNEWNFFLASKKTNKWFLVDCTNKNTRGTWFIVVLLECFLLIVQELPHVAKL